MLETNHRFQAADFMPEVKQTTVIIAGAGGIGSYVFPCAVKIGYSNIVLFDDDTVESHNEGSQNFSNSEIGKRKSLVLVSREKQQSSQKIIARQSRITEDTMFFVPSDTKNLIVVSCVDSIESRRDIYKFFKSIDSDVENAFFIDGRMNFSIIDVVCFKSGSDDDKAYLDSLSKLEENIKNEGEGNCSLRQVAYNGLLIGGVINKKMTNFMSNLSLGEDIYPTDNYYKNLNLL